MDEPIFCAIARCRKDITHEVRCHIPDRIVTGSVCESCANKWAFVEHDLPIAVMELHALAMLYPNAHGLNPGDPRTRMVAAAEVRVERLRRVEQELGVWY